MPIASAIPPPEAFPLPSQPHLPSLHPAAHGKGPSSSWEIARDGSVTDTPRNISSPQGTLAGAIGVRPLTRDSAAKCRTSRVRGLTPPPSEERERQDRPQKPETSFADCRLRRQSQPTPCNRIRGRMAVTTIRKEGPPSCHVVVLKACLRHDAVKAASVFLRTRLRRPVPLLPPRSKGNETHDSISRAPPRRENATPWQSVGRSERSEIRRDAHGERKSSDFASALASA